MAARDVVVRSTRRGRGTIAISCMLALVLGLSSACGGGGDGQATNTGAKTIIRFAFAPDPVIDYLKDTGTLAQFEEAWGVRLEMTSSWDEFAFFAGGHGDIVSMATTDMPRLEKETGIKVTGFGKYNHSRLILGTRCADGYKTMVDLKGKRFGVGNPVTTETIVGTYTNILHAGVVHFSMDTTDYEIVFNDHPVLPELIAKGDIDVAYMIPEFGVKYMREGIICGLYDNRVAFEMFRDFPELTPGHSGAESNLFVARTDWYDTHPYEVQFFLALWEQGVKLWYKNHTEIIGLYPQHFSVETPEDIAYIDQFIQDHQWVADTVYLNTDWVAGEEKLFALVQQAGFMDVGALNPTLTVVEPASPGDVVGGRTVPDMSEVLGTSP